MRRIAALLVCVVLALPVLAKGGFSGVYNITGTNPGVGAYRGVLTISPRGNVYDVHWTIANLQYTGVGIVVNDTLSVAYTAGDRTWIGVAAYRQQSDGSLDGRWAVAGGSGELGTERAVRK